MLQDEMQPLTQRVLSTLETNLLEGFYDVVHEKGMEVVV